MLLRRLSTHLARQDWTAVVLDFLIVVLGIFVGLQVSNWNESRKERAEEKVLLASLMADFEESERHFKLTSEYHQLVANAGKAIIEWGEAGIVPENEKANFNVALQRHGARWVFLPAMGTLDSLIGSERIKLIRNQELISELTRWPKLVAGLNRIEMTARDHYQERIYPFLASRLDNPPWLAKTFEECCFEAAAQFYGIEYPAMSSPTDASGLIHDREFMNMIRWHWMLSVNKADDLVPVQESLSRIRMLLQEEMHTKGWD